MKMGLVLYTVLLIGIAVLTSCYQRIFKVNEDGTYKVLKMSRNQALVSEKIWFINGNVKYHLTRISIDTVLEVGHDENEYIRTVVRSCHRRNYFESGTLREKGKIVKGKKHGVWRYYNQQGALISRATYDNGLRIDSTDIK